MIAILVIVNITLISFAIVAPWATITAFEAGRLAGWLMTLVSVISHAYTWHVMAQNSEILFCLSPVWAGYEFILSFIPMGIGEEIEQREAAETVVNKG